MASIIAPQSAQLSPAARQLNVDPAMIAVPVHLNAQVTLSSGQSNIVLGDAFRNPLPVPLEIHELKWSLTTVPTSGSQTTAHGLMIELQMAYQNYQITSAGVPLHALAPLVNSRDENNAFAGVSGGTFIQDTYGAAFGRMPFDEPIYLLPQDQLNISLNHKSIVPQDITVNVGISGRAVLSIPRVRKLPYLAVWSPSALDIGTALANAPARVDSTEKDLVNNSGAALILRRLIGRVVLSTQTQSGAFSFVSLGDSPDARDLVLCQIRNSHGVGIVKQATPMGVVFPPPSFSIEAPMHMPPNSYLLSTLTTQGFTNAANAYKANLAMVMVGYREIA